MYKKAVTITGVNTNNIKVLTHEEMTILFNRYKTGDMLAKEELINGNLKLVLSILKKYNTRNENMDDLFQIGVVGLIKAVDNFDLSHEVKFSTYAVLMIEGEIKRYIQEDGPIKVSRALKELNSKITLIQNEHLRKTGQDMKIEEIANKLRCYKRRCNYGT